MTHPIIATFIKDKYMIWNTDKSTKRPLVGTNDLGWSKISYKSVKQFWNFQQSKLIFQDRSQHFLTNLNGP